MIVTIDALVTMLEAVQGTFSAFLGLTTVVGGAASSVAIQHCFCQHSKHIRAMRKDLPRGVYRMPVEVRRCITVGIQSFRADLESTTPEPLAVLTS